MRRACLAIGAIILSGCATSPEVTAWNMAKEVNTPAAYRDYTNRYPNSGRAEDAREMVQKAEKERIMKASSVAECVGIMKSNPDPQTAAAVGDLAFKAAQMETSVEALYDFLAHFKGHAGAPAIRTRIEDLEFEYAGKDASPAAAEYFLYRYPGSRFEAEARRLLQERTFRQVKAWGNPYGYKAFLVNFPTSVHAAEARELLGASGSRRGLAAPQRVSSDVFVKNPPLRKHACALALSGAIRKGAGDADVLRRQLRDLEKGTPSAALPEMCASAGLKPRPDADTNLAEALQALAILEAQRKDLADRWETYHQRDDMVKAAIDASSRVTNDLETAELSEDVLGSGPLGRLDTGQEKGSLSAKRALDRFQAVQSVIRGDQEDMKRMLVEADAHYKPLLAYVLGCVEAN